MNVANLPGLFFLDTNILMYSFDEKASTKQVIAQNIIYEALRTQRGIISTQVVQEFLNLALRKFTKPMTSHEARTYLQTVLAPLCQHYPSLVFYDRALSLQQATGFALYDTLIVAAALDAGCSTLLSEDLQHERVIQGMKILNPFITT